MTAQTWIILTPAAKDAAVALNTDSVAVAPPVIDNPQADAQGHGPITGDYALPARVAADPDYAAWAGVLAGAPVATVDSALLFLPAAQG